ncbi:MAG: hypothetical protein IPG78_00735 [Ignavibacteria bacterium]|nr:hypothetical protein [Ignavibacteria bacterium]
MIWKIIYEESIAKFTFKYIQWKRITSYKEFSKYYFLNSKGDEVYKDYTTLNKKGDEFYHSVFIESESLMTLNLKAL